ncbi:MAG TPA: SRPBCC domain-containing protein [Thermoleophilaceae bacterium]|jgi:uncharacterized protein YndB with AHSA1/START domain
MTAPVATAEVVVNATPDHAFAIFTDEIGLWWRTGTPYWNDAERGKTVRIEPHVGGRFMEVYDLDTGEGFEVGRVTTWQPGERLAFTWTQADWPSGTTTTIELTFEPADGGTRVRLEHRGFEAVPDAEAFAGGYGAGWKEVLDWYTEHTHEQGAPD